MVDSVPLQARSAVEHAVTSSTMALDDLDRAGKHTSDQSHPTGPAAGGDRSRGGDGADAGDGVDADDAIARDPALGDPADLDAATHDRIPSETPASPATTQRDKTAGAGHVERRPPTPKPTNVDDHVNVDEHAPAASQRPHAAQARP